MELNQTKLSLLGLVLAFLGALISGYLVFANVSGDEIICGISRCGIVNNSEYSHFLGIPVSLWGFGFYIVSIALLLLRKTTYFFYITLVGIIFSAYLTFLEAFVIHAWCQWCLLSAWLSLSLFIIAIRLKKLDTDEAQAAVSPTQVTN
jgi:uncharacterized membrane protein